MPLYPTRIRSKKSLGRYDQNRQWVYIGERDHMFSVATQSSLLGIINDPTKPSTYYTPNGYYRRDKRLTETLRWLNAFVFDIDSANESLLDVLDRIKDAGLPAPTAVIQTPSGGFHVTYIFSKPVRATLKTIRLYTAIMSHIAIDIGSDPAAVGANRIFRTPSEKSIAYFKPENTYSFDFFKSWRDLNHPYHKNNNNDFRIASGNIMLTPALQQLLHSVCGEGRREQTCFTLALAMKASNWSMEQALVTIEEWHKNCCSKITKRHGKRPFSLQEALYKVRYVYEKEKLKGPSAEMIRILSGIDFRYSAFKAHEGKKPRDQRSRSHYSEWKEDTLALLRREKEIQGSQQDLANMVGCPLSTFKVIIDMLLHEKCIEVETKRGRGGSTLIRLIEDKEPIKRTNTPEIQETQEIHNSQSTVVFVDFKQRRRTNLHSSDLHRDSRGQKLSDKDPP